MERQNQNVRALLFSLVACVLGGAVFGLLYYLGYFWAWLCVIEIVLASALFFVFIKSPKWYHLVITVVWCTVWTFIFNFLSVFLCEILVLAKDFDMSFKEAYITVIDLWKLDVSIEEYFKQRITQIGCLTLFGSIVSLVYVISMFVTKRHNAQKVGSRVEIAQPVQIVQAESTLFDKPVQAAYLTVYNRVIIMCKDALTAYLSDKDRASFDCKIDAARNVLKLETAATKQLISTYAQKELTKELSKIDKRANEIIVQLV